MPTTQALPSPDQFFITLQELDDYQTRKLSERPSPNRTTPWTPRKTLLQGSRGKLLVCHDYKGGYVEKPQGLSYTFNYWSLADSFVYFSHNRVTIPPPGWVNAAHRQGVKMLGVLVFENDVNNSVAECLQLVIGKLPQSSTGSAIQTFTPSKLSISPHYAVALADLAAERGFDGYLMNVETWLQGGLEQARALAAWVGLLQSELIKRVGPHAEVHWYDSVTFSGSLFWQNRLNAFNLPFFIPSTNFFSNYSWPPEYCDQTAKYFLSIDPNIIGLATEEKPKTIHDVHMGVDVWGRGSYGGGGFGAYKAINHIAPSTLGLSVALFAQGWTWETIQDEPGFTWDVWWQNERNLWAGFPDPSDAPPDAGDNEGPYKPLSAFFQHLPPPDPIDVAFHTTFCPGVGFAWFIQGTSVSQFPNGWMDVDKQTAMGDLLWPAPALKLEAQSSGTVPNVAASVNMADSWNSGSSIQLDFSQNAAPNLAHRSFYTPIQTLSLTTQKSYTASIIYKLNQSATAAGTDPNVTLAVRPRNTSSGVVVQVTPDSIKTSAISNNWAKITIQFMITEMPPSSITVDSEIGIIITTVSSDTTHPFSLSILLGQINVHATPSPTTDPNFPRVLWADFTTSTITTAVASESSKKPNTDPSDAETQDATLNLTTISWVPSTSLTQVGSININSPDDPRNAWTPQPPLKNQWFPGFLYYNIFAAEPGAAISALAKVRGGAGGGSSTQHSFKNLLNEPNSGMIWIGTSGADGSVGKGRLEFSFDRTQLPAELRNLSTLRMFVQGVLDTGEVLSWESSAFVDVQF